MTIDEKLDKIIELLEKLSSPACNVCGERGRKMQAGQCQECLVNQQRQPGGQLGIGNMGRHW